MQPIPYRRLLKHIRKDFQRSGVSHLEYDEQCKKKYGISFARNSYGYSCLFSECLFDVRASTVFKIAKRALKAGCYISFTDIAQYSKDLRDLPFYEDKIEETEHKYVALKSDDKTILRLVFGPRYTLEESTDRLRSTSIFAHLRDGSTKRISLPR